MPLTIPDHEVYHALLLMTRGYYRDNPVGGSLHIALDDGNMEDSHLDFCIKTAKERQDNPGLVLARALKHSSMTQRLKVYRNKMGG